MNKTALRAIVLLVIAALAFAFFYYDGGQYLSFEFLKGQQESLNQFYLENAAMMIGAYLAIYIVSTAMSFPGATILTLAGGAIFGLGLGTVLVSIASTIGATLAFLVSRFFLRDFVQNKFKKFVDPMNKGIKKDGASYLFALRLVPAFPFFAVNLVMGLTRINTLKYFLVSQIGMLPGTIVYVNAGTQISQLESPAGILSPAVLLSFALLGIFPIIARKILDYFKRQQAFKGFKKPSSFDYNMVVIGAGSGGLVSAYIAAAVRSKVALIEKHQMGGDCLNTGCVPSKALIKSAKVVNFAKNAEKYGLKKMDVEFDFAEVMERVQRVVKTVEPHDSVERYTGLGVECIQGAAKIKSPFEVEVNGRTLTTKNIVVATGARPFVPPIPGLDKVKYLTSDNVWDLRKKPEKMVVLGGGPIGSELTQSFARLGIQVTQVEMAPRIMVREDPEISELVMKNFKKDGINVLTEHKAKEVVVEGDKKFLICDSKEGEKKIEFDEILLALGRRANVTGFGLEELGVRITDRGTVENDEFLRTNIPNIYVVGDVAGPFQFTHMAAHQAFYAAVNSLFSPFWSYKANYSVVPWATFTDPEVARVGLNESDAKAQGIPHEVTVYGIDDLDRAIADDDAHGFVKVITEPGKDKILGVTIVGEHAGDIIVEYVFAMTHGMGLKKIMGTIHIYPTLGEANKYAAGNWSKAHKPEGILGYVEKFHRWRRGGTPNPLAQNQRSPVNQH